MPNPHNITVGQEVILLKVGHNTAYKSGTYDEANVVAGVVTKIGRLYFTVKRADWKDSTVDFNLETLHEREIDTRYITWRFFFNREGIEQLKLKETLHHKVNKFLDKYRYGLNYVHDISMQEVQLWVELVDKVEALHNGK